MKKAVLLFLFLGSVASVYARNADRIIFQEAESRFRNQDYELALDRYTALIAQYPGSAFVPDAQFRRGVSLYHLGRYEEALSVLRRVETRFRSSAYIGYVPFWKGVTYYRMGDFRNAIEQIDGYIHSGIHQDLLADAYLYRGLAYHESQAYELSRQDLEKSMELSAETGFRPFTAVRLMATYLELGLYDESLHIYEKHRDTLDRTRWSGYASLYAAESLFRVGRTEESQRIYNTLRNQDPAISGTALLRLYEIAQDTGDTASMDAVLLTAEQTLSGRPEVLGEFYLRVGVEAYETQRHQIAELYLRRAWEMRSRIPVRSEIPLFLSEILASRGRRNEAFDILDEYLALPSADREDAVYRAAVHTASDKNWDEAQNRFAAFIREFPDSEYRVRAAYNHAYSLYRSGQYAESIEILDEYLHTGQAGDLRFEMLRVRAASYRKLGDPSRAAESLREYTLIRTDDIEARLEYVKVLFELNQHDDVVTEAEELLLDLETGGRPDTGVPVIEASYIMGLSYTALREYADAQAAFDRIPADREYLVNLDERFDHMYLYSVYYRGWVRYQKAEYDAAAEWFSRVLDEDRTFEFAPRAAYLAGWSYRATGQYEEAERILRIVSVLETSVNTKIEASFLLSQVLSSAGKLEEASVELRNLFVTHPNSEYADDARFEYAGILGQIGDTDQASEAYLRLYELYPDSNLAEAGLYRRGELFYSAERYEDARNAFFLYRSSFSEGSLMDGALYWGGMASFLLEERSGALLLWERLINEYRDSPHRPDALARAAKIQEERGEFRNALNLYTQLIVGYPEKAEEIQARRKADELVLLIGGLSRREASLWVRIENADRAETGQGRDAIIELARLLVYEGVGGGNISLIAPMLRETAKKANEAREFRTATDAYFLLGEYYAGNLEYETAAELFLEAAGTGINDGDYIARSLYRSAEMRRLAGREDEVRAIVDQLEQSFPNSVWTSEARRILGEGAE
jgi:TolA-binding protein